MKNQKIYRVCFLHFFLLLFFFTSKPRSLRVIINVYSAYFCFLSKRNHVIARHQCLYDISHISLLHFQWLVLDQNNVCQLPCICSDFQNWRFRLNSEIIRHEVRVALKKAWHFDCFKEIRFVWHLMLRY